MKSINTDSGFWTRDLST